MTTNRNNHFVQAYLFFNGNCEPAVDFYRQALGAEIEMLMRYKDSPEPQPPGRLPPGFENKIMHCTFRIGTTTLMASDGCSSEKVNFQSFSLSLSLPTEVEADRVFSALAEGGQVRMPLTKTFWSPRFGMVQDRFGMGWMVTVIPTSEPFTISRTFDAPLDKVWKAWTEREQLMQWFGPKGSKMTTANLDFRQGGTFHYCLQTPNALPMWGKFVYRAIESPRRIVLVSSFSDEQGSLTRHPMAPAWPLEMLSVMTLEEEDGKTKVALNWSPLNPSEEERKIFDGAHKGMQQGWNGTFDQLAEHLTKV